MTLSEIVEKMIEAVSWDKARGGRMGGTKGTRQMRDPEYQKELEKSPMWAKVNALRGKPNPAPRRCLKCMKMFPSQSSANRICPDCKESNAALAPLDKKRPHKVDTSAEPADESKKAVTNKCSCAVCEMIEKSVDIAMKEGEKK